MQRLIYRNRKGFSLIELIVVMAVMAILVLLAAPRFLGYTKDAAVSAMQADAKVLSNAALQYNIKTEAWPVTGSEITDLTVSGTFVNSGASADTVADLEDALYMKNVLITGSADPADDVALADIGLYAIAEGAVDADSGIEFSTLVKNTKNPIGQYYLITEGDYAGEVFYVKSLQDSSNAWHNGVYSLGTSVDQ